ncbi:MAG: hypothetical protein JWM57_812 [Phycisphaerales bacterium]|nr:hypothetical protein [Phycisphaerales bacterium]
MPLWSSGARPEHQGSETLHRLLAKSLASANRERIDAGSWPSPSSCLVAGLLALTNESIRRTR